MLCLSVHDVALLELQAFHGDVEVLQETCNSTSEFITRFSAGERCFMAHVQESISELCGRALNRFCGELEGHVLKILASPDLAVCLTYFSTCSDSCPLKSTREHKTKQVLLPLFSLQAQWRVSCSGSV